MPDSLSPNMLDSQPNENASALIYACWAYCVLPGFLSLFIYGSTYDLNSSTSRGIRQGYIYDFGKAGAVAFLAVIAISTLFQATSQKMPIPIARFLPSLFILVILVWTKATNQPLDTSVIIALAVSFIAPLLRVSFRTLRAVGICTVLTCLLSLLLAAQGSGFAYDWSWGQSKSIIGLPALAGPFEHPNTLGLALGLGIPFIAYFQKTVFRLPAFIITFFSLFLTSSRTSLLCVAIAIVLAFSLTRHHKVIKVLRPVALAMCLVVSSVIPFLGLPPTFATNRGLIWSAASNLIDGHWLTGNGATIYTGSSATVAFTLWQNLPSFLNSFLELTARFGLIISIAMTIFLFYLALKSLNALQWSAPGVFFYTFLFISSSVEYISFARMTGFSAPAIVPLVFLLPAIGPRTASTEFSDLPTEISLAKPVQVYSQPHNDSVRNSPAQQNYH